MFGARAGKRKRRRLIVVTITGDNKSFIERIPDSTAKIKRHPDFYREIHFVLDSRESIELFRDHFIYGYLEHLGRTGELPASLLFARSLEISVVLSGEE